MISCKNIKKLENQKLQGIVMKVLLIIIIIIIIIIIVIL
jgi:hypothetical protein